MRKQLPVVEESKVHSTWMFGFSAASLIILLMWEWLLR